MGQSAFTVGTGKQSLKHRLWNTNIIENMFFWSPYGIGQTIIFSCCGLFFFFFFFFLFFLA